MEPLRECIPSLKAAFMFTIHNVTRLALSAALATGLTTAARAQDSDIQKQLSNPIASLTLLPIQVNYDARIGPERDWASHYDQHSARHAI